MANVEQRCEPFASSIDSRWSFENCMQVSVEFFGLVRSRAGVAKTSARGPLLGDVLNDLARRFPDLADTCIDGRALRPGFIANLGGSRFVSSPETSLEPGETVMLLSVDAGG